jgi:hypothetical protein
MLIQSKRFLIAFDNGVWYRDVKLTLAWGSLFVYLNRDRDELGTIPH